MSYDIFKEERLEEERLKGEQLEKQKPKEGKSTKNIPKKERLRSWSPVLLILLGAIISAIPTIYSVFLVVDKTQDMNEEQEKFAVLKLLETAESDLNLTIINIDIMGKKEINADNSKGCVIPSRSYPDAIFPYPAILKNVITDKRVILNISNTNLLKLYSSEKKLDIYANDIIHMSYNNPHKEIKYANYRNELKFLQLVLSGEIKYQKGKLSEKQIEKIQYQKNKLSEEQIAKDNKGFESEALKNSPFERSLGLKEKNTN